MVKITWSMFFLIKYHLIDGIFASHLNLFQPITHLLFQHHFQRLKEKIIMMNEGILQS